MADDFASDLMAIERIEAIPTMLEIICRTTGMGFAAIARVTEDRWIACQVLDEIAFGLKPGGELRVETTICNEIRDQREPVFIDHVAADDDWRDHHTPQLYGFQSYVSVPITLRDGSFFGTLCAIDPQPHSVATKQVRQMFRTFADLIAFHLDANSRLAHSEASLTDERRTAELREQFIAVLGHDLRNPLMSISSGIHLLTRGQSADKSAQILSLMQGSVDRIGALIEDVLDFARARLGSGLHVELDDVDLAPVLTQATEELRAAHPDRAIEMALALPTPIRCDKMRLTQLFSNILGNALTHGAGDVPVRIDAKVETGIFELSVSNGGPQLEPAVLDQLFQPFARGAAKADQQGLGLGLYIASEIAGAHGGTLRATSTAEETRFTLRMPAA